MRFRSVALAFAAVCTALVGACATVPRLRAADDVHAFLVSIRNGDQAAFDAHVDRPALKTQLKARLMTEAGKGGGAWAALGVSLVGPLVDAGVELLVQPQVFRAEAARLGYDPEQPIPGVLAVATLVRPLGDGRACVAERRGGPCVFAFNDEGGVWRLAGYRGPLERLTAGPARRAPRPVPPAPPLRPKLR